MKADLLLKDRVLLHENCFVELVVWRLPKAVVGSSHDFKYRLALVHEGVCVLRYDNEAGKGDHKHLNGIEINYTLTSPKQLLADFWQDVDLWRASHE